MLDKSTSNDSCGISPQKLARCACCHTFGQVTEHWDHPTVNLCEACRHVMFVLEAHGSISDTAYQFHLRIQAGDL
jgi:acetone carboxylase gamma subunit